MTAFPFTAIVGQDDVKLALLLNAVDPRIGGVLLRGHKGSAKSTLARGLATLLPEGAPFVELPVATTEDRLVGTLDLAGVLADGEVRFSPGLLAAADGGVLYIDEVNLLPDHLVDVLLDVAASGVNRIEREGFSRSHPSRFVLVGSMNPEEGDLRPQLLDRFGLSVDVEAPADPAVRADVVRRRLAFDADPDGFVAAAGTDERAVRDRLSTARSAAVPDEVVAAAARICAGVGAEGLRGDLAVTRAAAALAGLEGRTEATVADARRVAPLALAHRRRRSPFDDHGITDDEIADALSGEDGTGEDADCSPPGDAPADAPGRHHERAEPAGPTSRVVALGTERVAGRAAASGRRSVTESTRGRTVGDRPHDERSPSALAARPTVIAAAARTAAGGEAALSIDPSDLRDAVKVDRAGNLVVLAVDASASMGAERRMEAVKGGILSLLLDAYQRRDRVSLVTFRGDRAEIALRPTGSVEIARTRLRDLPTGGRTPLAAGIEAALTVATSAAATAHPPLLVLVSDGRATASRDGGDPIEDALRAAAAVRAAGVRGVVIDADDAPVRLGLAARVSEAMGARYLRLPDLSAGTIAGAVTQELR